MTHEAFSSKHDRDAAQRRLQLQIEHGKPLSHKDGPSGFGKGIIRRILHPQGMIGKKIKY